MTVIRAAQFLDGGIVHCYDKDGKKIAITIETSVRSFVETKLKKKQIDDRTTIYARGEKKTVAILKKELGIGSFWRWLFKN